MQSLEDAKELSRVGHVESRPIVMDEIYPVTRFLSSAHLDTRYRAFASKFPRIAKQVFQENIQQPCIALDYQPISNDHLDFPLRRLLLKSFQHRLGEGAQVH